MTVEKNLRVVINFYKKHFLPVFTWNKNNLSRQVVPLTYTLKERFFAVSILFKVCDESFLSRHNKKYCDMLWTLICLTLLLTCREDNSKQMLIMTSKFIFLFFDSLIYQKVNLLRKIAIQNAYCVFIYFCGGHKNNFRLKVLKQEKEAVTNFFYYVNREIWLGSSKTLIFIDQSRFCIFSHPQEFSIFNNKPSASWFAYITRNFLTSYSCLYYSSTGICKNRKQPVIDVC